MPGGVKPYYEAVENLLREIEHRKVKSLMMVALVDDEEIYDVVSDYAAGPMELAFISGLLQFHAQNKLREADAAADEE